jgi:hypothetical protein
MTTLTSLAAVLLLSVSAVAKTSPTLKALSAAAPRGSLSAPPAVEAKPVAPTAARPKSSSYVTLSGPVSLDGSGFMSQGSHWVHVTLSGWASVQDSTGKIRSHSEHVTATASFMVSGGTCPCTGTAATSAKAASTAASSSRATRPAAGSI